MRKYMMLFVLPLMACGGNVRLPASGMLTPSLVVEQGGIRNGFGILGAYGYKMTGVVGHPFDRQGVRSWPVDTIMLGSFQVAASDTSARTASLNLQSQLLSSGYSLNVGSFNTYGVAIVEYRELVELARVIQDSAARNPILDEDLRDSRARLIIGIARALKDPFETRLGRGNGVRVRMAGDTAGASSYALASRRSTVSPGTVIGYKLARLCWTPGRLRLYTDYPGVTDGCARPTGSAVRAAAGDSIRGR